MEREQVVIYKVKEFYVDSGVPQGTAMDLLLFLLCINDLYAIMHAYQYMCLFADDSLIDRLTRSSDDWAATI